MNIPKAVDAARQKLSEYVQGLFPQWRNRMSNEEIDLAVHLRGNTALHDALRRLIQARIGGRLLIPEPSDPVDCKSLVARDRELQWLIHRLEFIYRSPIAEPEQHREQPE